MRSGPYAPRYSAPYSVPSAPLASDGPGAPVALGCTQWIPVTDWLPIDAFQWVVPMKPSGALGPMAPGPVGSSIRSSAEPGQTRGLATKCEFPSLLTPRIRCHRGRHARIVYRPSEDKACEHRVGSCKAAIGCRTWQRQQRRALWSRFRQSFGALHL